jgi:pimeloyl-ACP methyl ester carboxylesterase
MRRLAPAVLALVLVAAGAAPARAALQWSQCKSAQAFECAILRVPLDHSGKVPGTIPLHVARTKRGTHARYLVTLSGGPGQSAVADADFTADALSSARSRYGIIAVDQRGTGDSDPLSCPALQKITALNAETPARVRDCANRIGAARAFFSTADTVADLESLRQALHVPKLALQGISYGTFVAEQYARTYPTHTDRLILDSVVGKDGVDNLLLDTYAAIPRLVREQCANGSCQGITTDPLGDIRTLAKRIETHPLTGHVIDARGQRRTMKLGAVGLAALLVSGDLNPHLQAALPAAVHSAVTGDATPLLHLIQPAVGPPTPLRDLSEGLNIATTCDDNRMSFAIDSPVSGRPAALADALANAPTDRFGPFDRELVGAFSVDEECLLYPPTVTTAPSTAPLPDVPALVLSGRQDWRTPLENGQSVAAEMPHGRSSSPCRARATTSSTATSAAASIARCGASSRTGPWATRARGTPTRSRRSRWRRARSPRRRTRPARPGPAARCCGPRSAP